MCLQVPFREHVYRAIGVFLGKVYKHIQESCREYERALGILRFFSVAQLCMQEVCDSTSMRGIERPCMHVALARLRSAYKCFV